MKLAKLALLTAALAVPAFTAEAQRSRSDDSNISPSGELGYVTGDGIVLRPHPAFVSASRAVSGDADRTHSKWSTCMSGMDLSMAFRLDRASMYRYRRNPQLFCGPEPRQTSAGSAESFQIRESIFSISQGRRAGGVLANFEFTTGGDQLVSGSDRLASRCLVLSNSRGQLIPVRSTRDGDPYTFVNPFRKNADPVSRYSAEVQQLSSRVTNGEGQLANLQTELAGSRAWRGRQCVRPSSGVLPPRPAGMSDAAVTAAARGFCTDMSMRRLPQTQVIAALRSNYMDGYISAQRAWERGAKAQCAINIRSQVEDQFTLLMVRYGPTMAGYGMIQDSILKCEAVASQACGAPLSNWQRQVSAIQAGPQAELSQCQGLVSRISSTRTSIESARPQLETARANLEAAQAAGQPEAQSLPLSQARCNQG